MTGYLAVAGVVLAVNLLPAFGPPTWAVLVLFKLHLGLAVWPLVLTGAVAAATGRLALAAITKRLGGRMSVERQTALASMRDRVLRHRAGALAGLGFFALSPVPSGQLFVAAGLFQLPLAGVTAAFFGGRIVSYAVYVSAASVVDRASTERALESFRSPVGVGVQILLLGALSVAPVLLARRVAGVARDEPRT